MSNDLAERLKKYFLPDGLNLAATDKSQIRAMISSIDVEACFCESGRENANCYCRPGVIFCTEPLNCYVVLNEELDTLKEAKEFLENKLLSLSHNNHI